MKGGKGKDTYSAKGHYFRPAEGRDYKYQLPRGLSTRLGSKLIQIVRNQPHHRVHGHTMPLKDLLAAYQSEHQLSLSAEEAEEVWHYNDRFCVWDEVDPATGDVVTHVRAYEGWIQCAACRRDGTVHGDWKKLMQAQWEAERDARHVKDEADRREWGERNWARAHLQDAVHGGSGGGFQGKGFEGKGSKGENFKGDGFQGKGSKGDGFTGKGHQGFQR